MPQEGTGSGFLYDEEGHVVTNYHVVQGADSIDVKFSDKLQIPARVVGVDPRDDLAVLAPERVSPGLQSPELGSSSDLRVGQRTVAISNPFGLDRTLLNSRGEVIGTNTAIRDDAQGIGFAVPVNTVKRIVPGLIEQGVYPHPRDRLPRLLHHD